MNEGEFKQVLSQPGPLSQPRQRSSPLAHKSGPGPHRNLTSFQARDRGHPYQRNAAPREPSPEVCEVTMARLIAAGINRSEEAIQVDAIATCKAACQALRGHVQGHTED